MNSPLFGHKPFFWEVEDIVELAGSLTDLFELFGFKTTLSRYLTGKTFLLLFNDMVKTL